MQKQVTIYSGRKGEGGGVQAVFNGGAAWLVDTGQRWSCSITILILLYEHLRAYPYPSSLPGSPSNRSVPCPASSCTHVVLFLLLQDPQQQSIPGSCSLRRRRRALLCLEASSRSLPWRVRPRRPQPEGERQVLELLHLRVRPRWGRRQRGG